MALDRYTLLREMGYYGTLAEMETKYLQNVTGLNTIGEQLDKALDPAMARQFLEITAAASGLVTVPNDLQASGIPSATTFLRGDGSWAVPAGGGGGGGVGTDPNAVQKTGNESVAGIKTFTDGIVVPDASVPQAKVTGLPTALGLKADAFNPVFTGSVNAPDDSIPQTAILNLITTLAAKLDKSVYDAFFATTQFASYDVFCPNDVDVVRPALASTARVRWHKLTRPIFGGAYAQVRDSWVMWSG